VRMTKSERLLKAVIEDPDDDTPRLEYADWLKKNKNSARADFIRVQCALDKLPADAPDRPPLLAYEKELLEQHAWDWAEEFKGQITEWVYRRGFIERVQICLETSAEKILAVLSKAPIRHLRDMSQFCDFSGMVTALPSLNRLTGLEFWCLYAFDNALVHKLLTSRQLRGLRTLILHHDRNGNMVKEKVLIEALASSYRSDLVELGVNIDGCWRGPSNRILEAMAESRYLLKLRKLYLSCAGDKGNRGQLNRKTVRTLGSSRNFAHLEELDLGHTSFTIEVWNEVLKWPWLSHLKWLRLHHARQVKAPDYFVTVAALQDLPEYRQALEARVSTVDWDTEYVHPWVGNTLWQGFKWEDRPK
jgi:uncharacterized protein (TIGR02996 family)